MLTMLLSIAGDFPTYVGMNRISSPLPFKNIRFPHLCGDEPSVQRIDAGIPVISPPMWG